MSEPVELGVLCEHVHFTYLHNVPGKSQPMVCPDRVPTVEDGNLEAATAPLQAIIDFEVTGGEGLSYYKPYELTALAKSIVAAWLGVDDE